MSSNLKKVDSKSGQKNYTHLNFQTKHLKAIPNCKSFDKLTSLYLQDNKIQKIEHLDGLENLTNLYLHNNKIKKIENLDTLLNLKILYLNHNEISVLENINNLKFLEELYIEKQYLKFDEALCFDPRTILNIANSLQILNISHNGIKSIVPLSHLKFLKLLNASFNKIRDIKDIQDSIKHWYYLYEAKFMGNPVSKQHKYRENIIMNTVRLEILDDKIINETTRCFIKRLEHEKETKTLHKKINLADMNPDLPKNYSLALQKAASASIIQKSLSQIETNSDSDTSYIPWNGLPKKTSKVPPMYLKMKKQGYNSTIAGTFPNL